MVSELVSSILSYDVTIAENTRSRTSTRDLEGVTNMLKEFLRKFDAFNARLVAVENVAQKGKGRMEDWEGEGKGGSGAKMIRRLEMGGDRATRQTKLEFPSFDGNMVHEWLFKCDRFFELDDTPDEQKVDIASMYLSGLALEWHYAFVKNMRLQSPVRWEEYVEAMTTRFGPIKMQRPIAQLKRLKEEECFYAYVDAFVSLVSQVELSDEDQVAMFIEGLKRDNKRFVTILNP